MTNATTQTDGAIAAAPADAAALEARAQMRAATSWEALPVLDDCRKALALRVAAGEPNGDWAQRGRDWQRQGGREREFGARQYARCQALACFERALQESPAEATLWVESAQCWAAIGERARAESDFDKARELDGENAQSWFLQAQIFQDLRQYDGAYAAYYHGLFAGELSGEWALDAATALRESGQTRPDYQKRAWLDVAIEGAPADADLFLARAQLPDAHRPDAHRHEGAAADFARAIELRPDDPTIYEARADASASRASALVVQDYQTAARLRMESGEWAREVSELTTRAKAAKNLRSARDLSNTLRAIALYGLAIEIAPELHTLYLARAQLRRKIDFSSHRFHDENLPLLDDASEDWIAALKLKPQVKQAIHALADVLARSARRVSAHEQLETWLEVRALLRQRGLRDETIGAIVARTQATWQSEDDPTAPRVPLVL